MEQKFKIEQDESLYRVQDIMGKIYAVSKCDLRLVNSPEIPDSSIQEG
jgi:hypothetical protein